MLQVPQGVKFNVYFLLGTPDNDRRVANRQPRVLLMIVKHGLTHADTSLSWLAPMSKSCMSVIVLFAIESMLMVGTS